MQLRNRKTISAPETAQVSNKPTVTASAESKARSIPLFAFFVAFRVVNALLTRTFFQPDEYFQSQEIAHKLVFGSGYVSWEWLGSPAHADQTVSWLASARHNLVNGPIRSVLHPLLFVPGYWLLGALKLDEARLLVLLPRLQQALLAAVGDVYTFKLARRIGGERLAWFATLVNLSNLYTLYTATRTFSNTTESALTSVALYYWPFVPCSPAYDAHTFVATAPPTAQISQSDQEFESGQQRRKTYDANISRALCFAAVACVLRPTNAILWMYLVFELASKSVTSLRQGDNSSGNAITITATLQIIGELTGLARVVVKIALASIIGACAIDTTFDYVFNQRSSNSVGWPLPALSLVSFFHRNVMANLSIFYGQNAWHWYLTQGVPVLCTIWLPATVYGFVSSLTSKGCRIGTQVLASLAKVCSCTIVLMSFLGHKEFRFLQPLLGPFSILAGNALLETYSMNAVRFEDVRNAFASLPWWLRGFLLTVQPAAAGYLLAFHAVAQESVPWHIGTIYRDQLVDPASHSSIGKIHSLGVLMPCHSLPWASHLHSAGLVRSSWFIECLPPPAAANQSTYKDQSDFFYDDPISYLVKRFPHNVDISYPLANQADYLSGTLGPWDQGWRHYWPSHLLLFENLLDTNTKQPGHSRTLRNLLTLKGYKEVSRYWNTPKHEDPRRDGDILLLAYKGPQTKRT